MDCKYEADSVELIFLETISNLRACSQIFHVSFEGNQTFTRRSIQKR